jgi:thioredoxin-dependent peroxiredoxin
MSNNINIENSQIPAVTFKTRALVGAEYEWKDLTTDEIFKGRKVVVFSLPGAFTPTCSSTHLPGYEATADEFMALGIDDIYVLSVNDAFVMNAWIKDHAAKYVKVIPDGNAELTEKLGMLVKKENLGFGKRSWRYSMYVEDGLIKKVFAEPGFGDNVDGDPFEVSDANTMLDYLGSK